MRKLGILVLGLLVAASLCSFAGGQAGGGPSADKPIVMKVAHAQPEHTPRHKSYLRFKELVEERTDGAITVEIYPHGQLGVEHDVTEQVKMGAIQSTRSGSFEMVTPKLLIYTMPFLFETIDGLHKITRGPIGEKIAEDAEKNGFKLLATGDAGYFRHITNNVRPIRSPADMKGLKVRTPPIESIIKTMEALGANPVSIAYAEVYMALKTGVADGQENPFINIEAMKFNEVQKYLTIVNYQWHPDPFAVNLDWYNSLSSKHQKIVKKAAEEAMEFNDDMMKEANDVAFAKIKDTFDEVVELSDAERQAFIDAVKPVYDYYIDKGLFTMAELEEIRKAAK
jgi:tripartite ATP-independent transporter DctP family solute receptor